MIRSFRDRRTRLFFAGETIREFLGFKKVAERKLVMLDSASDLKDLVSPGNRLEKLKGIEPGSTVSELTINGGSVSSG
jgi:toxin HigB-1